MFLAALLPTVNSEVSLDAMLVYRLLQKDMRAFEQLYDRHSRIVYGLLLRILQQAGTAEEVAQDVFLRLWRNAGHYDESRGPFVPWLLALARNRALDTRANASAAASTKRKNFRPLSARLPSTKYSSTKSVAPKKYAPSWAP